MRRILLALVGLLIAATTAHAQNWTSYSIGNQRYYNGSNGWNGSSYSIGNQTYTNFNGPNGQSAHCSSYSIGNQTYTNCN